MRDPDILLPSRHKDRPSKLRRVKGGKLVEIGEAKRRYVPEGRDGEAQCAVPLDDDGFVAVRNAVVKSHTGMLKTLALQAAWAGGGDVGDYKQFAIEEALRLFPEWDPAICHTFGAFIATPVRRALYDQIGRDRCIVRNGGFNVATSTPWGFDEDGEPWTLGDNLVALPDGAGGYLAESYRGRVEEAAIVQRLSAAAEAQTITACLMTQAETDRQAVIWRHYSGMTDAEMAGRWGCKADTARKRADRALDRLQKIIGRGLSENGARTRTYIVEDPVGYQTVMPAGFLLAT